MTTWVLLMKSKRAKKWHPVDVFVSQKCAGYALRFHQSDQPGMMFEVRPFKETRGK